LNYELEECFGFSETAETFCGFDTVYTSALGQARFIGEGQSFIYEAGEYNQNNVDEFCVLFYDQQHNQYDTTYVVITVNDVMDTVATGIDMVASENNQIDIFPNPAGNVFYAAFQGEVKETKVRIINTIGEIMTEQRLPAGTKHAAFNALNWAPGVYLMTFETERAFTLERLVIE
jgi:hypothetical protein